MKLIAPGIRKTRYGFQVYVQVGGRFVSEHHPKTAMLGTLKARRDEMTVEARKDKGHTAGRPTAHRGTLAADVKTYLAQVAAMKTIAFRERDLNRWLEKFGDRPRASLTVAEIREQLQTWRTVGPTMRYRRTKGGGTWVELKRPLSASACNHRRTALLHLFTILDGKDAQNPVRAVPKFGEPAPEPRGQSIDVLKRIIARVRSPKPRARLSVLMWIGARGNCELGQMRPEHVKLKDKMCWVPTAKGGQKFRIVPLNDEGVEAWQAFIDAKAWGEYDKDGLRTALRRAARAEMAAAAKEGREVPNVERLRVYDLRHSVATELRKMGADLADVQEFLGHTTPRMTKRYSPMQLPKLTAAVERLKTSA